MNPLRIASILVLILLLPTLALAWTGKAVHITDGDTIKVLRGKEQVKIRLYGIDCPERRQPFGRRASQFTAELVGNEMVEVRPIELDRYGRTVAQIILMDGRNLSEELVRAGLAWVYTRYCDQPVCERWLELEAKAREEKRGLWVDPTAAPPWAWRRR